MRNKRLTSLTAVGVIAALLLASFGYLYFNKLWIFASDEKDSYGEAYVDFIDCGQGDSSLIVSNDCVTLIDTTTAQSAQNVVDHLEDRGIEKIDHLVLTHPHEDHIGGTSMVLDTVEVETIYMKEPTKGTKPTSKVYKTLIDRIKDEAIEVSWVEVGDSFECGDFNFTVLGPTEDYKDQNNQSIVLMAEYDDVSVLFTGDQEEKAEKDLIEEYGYALDVTVLKAGHHGSKGSTCDAFLDVVRPEYSVISCGEGNSYGHPHDEFLERMEERNITYYRTDRDGTVTVYTNGDTVTIEKQVKADNS